MSVIYYTSLILGAAFLNLTKRRRDSTCSSALPRVHSSFARTRARKQKFRLDQNPRSPR